MAKLARPDRVLSRFSSAMTWSTTAVDDIASARPITDALSQSCPSRTAADGQRGRTERDLQAAEAEHQPAHQP